MTINELDDVCDVKGESHQHLIIFYGSRVRQLRTFCQLYSIEAVCRLLVNQQTARAARAGSSSY